MITVFAEISVKPGRRQAVLAAITALTPAVLAEAGCYSYIALVDTPTPLIWQKQSPDSIFMLETWQSVEQLELHLQMPHMQQHQQLVQDDVLNVIIHILDHALPASA